MHDQLVLFLPWRLYRVQIHTENYLECTTCLKQDHSELLPITPVNLSIALAPCHS